MKLKPLLFTALLCLITLPTQASEALTPQGAGHLKAVFESILRDQTKITSAQGNVTLEQQGDVIVEATRDFYAVTLPHLQLRYKDGSRFELGIISINAAPHNTQNSQSEWKMTLALPTPMRLYDAQNQETTRIAIKGQQAAGIFHENIQQFSKLDASYQNITIESANPAYKVTIPKTILRFDMNAQADGRWSGPAYIEFQDIEATQQDATKSANIKSIKVAFKLDRLDPTAMLTYRKRLINLIDQKAFGSPEMSPEHKQRLGSAIYDIFTKGMNGFTSTYSISGLNLQQPAEAIDAAPETFRIDDAKIALHMGGFLDGNANLGINYSYNGFNTSTISAQDKDIIPSEANLDINIKKIPFNQLVQIGQNTLSSGAADNPQALQMAGLGLLLKVPALLSGAGTTIEIKDNNLGNAVYRAALNGNITADITASNSATAKATGTFKGLDALIDKLKAITDSKKQKKINRLTQNLEWIKSFGKAPLSLSKDKTYSYDFVMDAQGNMLLNGKDIRTLKQPPASPAPQE